RAPQIDPARHNAVEIAKISVFLGWQTTHCQFSRMARWVSRWKVLDRLALLAARHFILWRAVTICRELLLKFPQFFRPYASIIPWSNGLGIANVLPSTHWYPDGCEDLKP